jgi:hypothetical protein
MKYQFPMKPKLIQILTLAVLIISLGACEKEVHINLKSSAPRMVVQGSIETDGPPIIVLTSSVGFFSKIDLSTLENSFIHGADIKVSDGTKTVTLKEYSSDTGTAFKYYFYTLDTALLSAPMLGENGQTYTLTITHGGVTYRSVTKIPIPQGVDSMWFGIPEFADDNTLDSARQLFINYKDPDSAGDYVRYFTQRGNDAFYPSGNFSDEPVNGKLITSIGLAGGYVNDGTDREMDSLIYFFPGESVTLKWCAVDKGVYTFWNTLDFAKNAVGNPFSSPINPVSNISNGALGVWAGYGAYYKTLVVTY